MPPLLECHVEHAPLTLANHRASCYPCPSRLPNPSLQPGATSDGSAISEREVSRVFVQLLASGLVESSVVRYRASLSAFFGWCVREKLIGQNPVTRVKVPKGSEERTEMHPFTEDELWEVYEACRVRNERLASIVLVLGWTGLRWGEARGMTVGDVVEVPTPGLMVRRSRSEGST